MSIRDDIEKKYKQSLIEKNTNLTNTLRSIKSAIKYNDIASRGLGSKDEIKDQEILGLLQNLIKQRKDSIESFKIANRQDLIEKEQSDEQFSEWVDVLFDQALLAEQGQLDDPASFASKLNKLLLKLAH